MTAVCRRLGVAVFLCLSLAMSSPAFAQAGGFVYALDQVNGAPNQIYGYSVDPTTGVLTLVPGFPVAAGNGGSLSYSEMLAYDRENSRLYALNAGANTISAFTVNRLTGAIVAMPFSPIALPATSNWGCVAAGPDGSTLLAGDGSTLATFKVTAGTATAAPGSPVTVSTAQVFSCAFSQDGAFVYGGGLSGSFLAGFAVDATTGALTPIAGLPINSGATNPVGYATDASGRLFVSNFGAGVRVFTSSATGALTAATGNPFASGLSGGVQGLVTPSGFYMVADRSANKVGVFRISGTGTATTLTAAAGSPFASGGTFTDALAQDRTGTLLFAANGTSRNITTFRVATAGTALTSLSTQAVNAAGTTGSITGIAFAPPATGGFVYALDEVNAGASQVYGFSLNTSTGALTALPGFPVAAGTGGSGALSEHMTYDRLNGRLYVLNEGSATINAFNVNRSSGAVTALPFSPIVLPAGDWACVTVSPDGGVLAAGGSVGVSSFKIGASTATPAAGNPFATPSTSPFSCAFSQDGAFFYTGGNVGSVIAGFSVNASTGVLTALAGSPFASGAGNPVGYATDASGRLFVSSFGGAVRAFTTASGVPTAVTGNPFTSGLSGGVAGAVTASGFYVVADRSGNRVGSFAISGAGAATTLTAAPGSPFATGGSFSATIASDDTGTLVFVGNGLSRNLTVFNVGGAGALTSLGVQAVNTLGASGAVTGIAFAPLVTAASSEVTAAGSPRGITSGPDGNVWYTEIAGNKIARITTAGVITEFPTPTASAPDGITTGPDGNLWYAGFSGNKIGRVTPAGVITEFAAGAASGPALIASGPDGNLWFTEFNSHKIGRIKSDGTGLIEFSAGITALAQPYGIAAGPDGNLWFTESAANKIGRISTGGAVTEFALPTPNSFPAAIVAGPDGALWFAETGTTGTGDRIGRITTAGTITEFGGLSAGPGGITLGPDNNLWFSTGTGVGRITTVGTVTEYTPATSPIASATFPAFITAGPDGNIWFAEQANNKIGLVVLRRFGLSIVKAGTGAGTVTSAPAALSCGATCGATFADGALVTLTAAASAGSRFAGWSGAGCAGTGTCTVAMTSARLVTATFDFNCPAITVNPAVVATPVIGTVYTQTMSQSGGVGTATFAVTSGALPAGLSMSPAGVITGTPTAQGASSSFTITATDANGCTGSRAYSATVAGLPSVGLSLATVNFGAVNNGAGTFTVQTPSQSVALTLSGPGTVTWTAVATQPWITVSPASGSGPGSITISVNNAGGGLPTSGLLTGAVNLTTTGASNNPSAAVNLTILAGVSTPPEGLIDTPTEGQANVTGSLAVTGWAVDDIGVSAVRLCRMPMAGEGVGPDARCGGQPQIFIGDTVLVSGARPDIMAAFPVKPLNAQAGWGYLLLTNFLPAQGNGTFTLVVFAEDFDGHTTQLGTRAITCTNASATAPLGAIDTPTQGGTASGAAFVNFGWALTPQPKSIPTDGSTIQPYIDSIPVGTVTYNQARADIQALFPGYANTNGAVGFSIINTTLLSNGVHTIAWVVTDNQGAASGIGSRYFTVLNGGSSLVAAPSATAAAPTALVAGGGAAPAAQRDTPAPAVQALATILGTRREVEGIETRRAAIGVTLGFGDGSASLVKADPAGVHQVTLRALGRIVLELDPDGDGAQHRGYEIQGNDLTALPVGSQFDPALGRFTWAPGLGVGGTRHFVFVRSIGGRDELIRVDISIEGAK